MSEFINDDDRVAALKSWWSANGTGLIVGLLVVIGGVIGWRWYNDYTQGQQEAASAAFQRYAEAHESGGKAADLDALAAKLDTDYPRSPYRAFTLFYRARDAAAAGDAAKAAAYLETAAGAVKDAGLRDVAWVRLAQLQVQKGETDAALATLAKVTGAGFRSYVAELKGDILLGQHKPDAALEAYRAAASAAAPGQPQTVLEMKIADLTTADAPAP